MVSKTCKRTEKTISGRMERRNLKSAWTITNALDRNKKKICERCTFNSGLVMVFDEDGNADDDNISLTLSLSIYICM